MLITVGYLKLIHFSSQLKNKCLVIGNELVFGNLYLAFVKKFGDLAISGFGEWRILQKSQNLKINQSAITPSSCSRNLLMSFLLCLLSNTFVPQIF
jgi:hypothetical protein